LNPETIDSEYAQLEQQASQVSQAIAAFSQKLQAAAGAGNAQAEDLLLDLKSLAIEIQQEQLQTQTLLQAVHDFTVSNLSEPNAQPQYAPQPAYNMRQGGGGSPLSRFMGGGFGRAIMTGAGFGIGNDLIRGIHL
jgi:hypothetical protein